jgi:hypothetical protein
MFARLYGIKEQRRPGHWFPILRSLAAQGLATALCQWGDIHSDDRWVGMCNPARDLKFYRDAIMRGDRLAMYNLSITHRNWNEMKAYRHWLARAAQFDDGSKAELKRFRMRFSHDAMRRWHRFARER